MSCQEIPRNIDSILAKHSKTALIRQNSNVVVPALGIYIKIKAVLVNCYLIKMGGVVKVEI